jgi:hypothetical protein
VDMEKCFCKIRWSKKDEVSEDDKMKHEESEEERLEKLAEEEAIRYNLVFDQDEMTIDYRKRRATSCKHNT